jgi:hypothetical protein
MLPFVDIAEGRDDEVINLADRLAEFERSVIKENKVFFWLPVIG